MKKIRLIIPLVFVVTALVMSSCSSTRKTVAIEEGWELIGETKVNFVRDRSSVQVVNSNPYTALRFKVEKKAIRLKSLDIVFQNGDKLAPLVDSDIEPDQFSRDIVLGPEGKSIRSIDFNYRSKGSLLKGRARVLIFAKRYTPYRY
ncbi:MAG: hypothetical protein EOO06_17755 [Chitinophagaceae bacterium]|nr:MAG: hypothetical protein EOO06_17755 [Chitinophagaceae bacterium]